MYVGKGDIKSLAISDEVKKLLRKYHGLVGDLP